MGEARFIREPPANVPRKDTIITARKFEAALVLINQEARRVLDYTFDRQ